MPLISLGRMPTTDSQLSEQVLSIQLDYPRIYHACHARHRRAATSHALPSAADAAVLAHVEAMQPASAAALSRHLGVRPSTLTPVLERLTRLGWIARETDAADRRVSRLSLTQPARAAIGAASVLDGERLARLLAGLTAAQRARAVAGMRLLGAAAARQPRHGRPAEDA